jgi:hypothetical protein
MESSVRLPGAGQVQDALPTIVDPVADLPDKTNVPVGTRTIRHDTQKIEAI